MKKEFHNLCHSEAASQTSWSWREAVLWEASGHVLAASLVRPCAPRPLGNEVGAMLLFPGPWEKHRGRQIISATPLFNCLLQPPFCKRGYVLENISLRGTQAQNWNRGSSFHPHCRKGLESVDSRMNVPVPHF